MSVGGVTHNIETDFIVESDGVYISWKSLGMDGILSVGDEFVVSYVAVRSKRPNNGKANKSVIRQYTTRIENRKLTLDEINNKSLQTEDPVSVGDGMKMTVGAFDHVYGVDFRLEDTQTVSWDGLLLDGTDDFGNPLLNVDDEIILTYTSANYFEREIEEPMYDEDWILDYVTALSKISLGIVRRKLSNFSSMGNQGISLDGDSMVSDGQSEKEYLEDTLRNEEAYEGYGIFMG